MCYDDNLKEECADDVFLRFGGPRVWDRRGVFLLHQLLRGVQLPYPQSLRRSHHGQLRLPHQGLEHLR